MIIIRKIEKTESDIINEVVEIHLNTFKGFFLTFMGRGFLRQMYKSYCEHKSSGLLVAFYNKEKPIGFLAYSGDMSGLYKYMIKKHLFPFAWYSFFAFLRKPKAFMRIIRAFTKSNESKRLEKYIKLSSIGVKPDIASKGIGTKLIDELKKIVDFKEFDYIQLETDALDNEGANYFYQKNGFMIKREFETNEGRKMFEYRFRGEA